MDSSQFTISYEGPALSQNTMDVKDLAPALLSLGKALEESNKALNKDRARLHVHVTTFQDGSFEVTLDLTQNILSHLTSFLTSDGVISTLNLLAILGFVKGSFDGLVAILKKERGRKPQKATTLENGDTKIDYGDDDPVVIPRQVLPLYQDLEIRNSLRQSIAPLDKEGIDNIFYKLQGQPQENIAKADVQWFDTPETEERVVNEYEQDRIFSIVSLSFKEDNKWRLDDGSGPIHVIIKDEDFLKKVDSGEENFSKGDRLKVRLLTRQKETSQGLRLEYVALKILDHYTEKQLRLPLD